MNLRNAVTRTLTYTIVEVFFKKGQETYTVYGETTPKKELKKIINKIEDDEIPTITTMTITEKRAMTIEDFLELSTVVKNEE